MGITLLGPVRPDFEADFIRRLRTAGAGQIWKADELRKIPFPGLRRAPEGSGKGAENEKKSAMRHFPDQRAAFRFRSGPLLSAGGNGVRGVPSGCTEPENAERILLVQGPLSA